MTPTPVELLRLHAASHYYRNLNSPFIINETTQATFSSPFLSMPNNFQYTRPSKCNISIMIHLPNPSYGPEYQAFQYVQLWQELLSAASDHDPLFSDNDIYSPSGAGYWAPSKTDGKQPSKLTLPSPPTPTPDS